MGKFVELFIISLMMFSLSLSIVTDLQIDKDSITAYQNLTLSYRIEFLRKTNASYSIKLLDGKEISILEKRDYFSYVYDQIEWNSTNTPAGNYTLWLIVSSDFLNSSEVFGNLKILPYAEISLSEENETILFLNDTNSVKLNVTNEGNVNLTILTEIVDLPSEVNVSIIPSFKTLHIGESLEFQILLTKPNQEKTIQIKFIGKYNNLKSEKNLTINLKIPKTEVILENITFSKINDEILVNGTLSNKGNFDQNLNISFSYSSIPPKKEKRKLFVPKNTTIDFNFTIPNYGEISEVEISYLNENGNISSIKKKFKTSIISSISDAIEWIFRKENRATLAVGVLAIIFILIYMKIKGRRRKI